MGPPALAPKSLNCWILLVLGTPPFWSVRGQVAALEGIVGPEETGRAADLVAAAAGQQVHRDAARLERDVAGAARRDRDGVDRVEVVGDAGPAEVEGIADVDAVDRPGVVDAVRAVAPADEMGLVARFVAADVLPVEHDRRDELDDGPGIARRRQDLELAQANEAPVVNLVLSMTGEGVPTLTVSSAFPGSRTRSTATRPPSATTTPDRVGGLEVRELGLEAVVRAGEDGREAEDARRAGDRPLVGGLGPRERDGDAGEGLARLVDDLALDVARSELCRQGQREEEDSQYPHSLLQ